MAKLKHLTDNQLRDKLKDLGVSPGPITATTRPLYEKKVREREDGTYHKKAGASCSSRPAPASSPHGSNWSKKGSTSSREFLSSIEIGGEIEQNELDYMAISLPSSPACSTGAKAEFRYDWELAPADIAICVRHDGSRWRLGRGAFGVVLKGVRHEIDEVAVKVIPFQDERSISQFKSEINMISKLRHRHIVQFYGACTKRPCLYMVTELMQSNLMDALKCDKCYHWSGSYGQDVAKGIVSGLHYLHSHKPTIVHRDLKSPNILVMNEVAKIADVGLARTKDPNSDMTAQDKFTRKWAAPEVVNGLRATEKIDIYSFGVILWEIFTGREPSSGHLVMPFSACSSLTKLFLSCTSLNPADRPRTRDIFFALQHMIS